MFSFLKRVFRWVLVLFIVLPTLLTLVYRYLPVPVTPLMVIRLVQGESFNKHWQPAERIAHSLKASVIASEDNKFCQHSGFDWDAFKDVASEFTNEGKLHGVSTISMQTAKNLYLWPSRSWLRKGLEAAYTPMLELLLPKDRIMTLYLNIAEFGPGIYGAEAAAQAYFNTSAAQLSPHQSALLAAVLPNPREYNAGRPSTYVLGRAATIGVRVQQLGPLTQCVAK